eukprot:6187726-Pleurochrysis_carterae.AAC.1
MEQAARWSEASRHRNFAQRVQIGRAFVAAMRHRRRARIVTRRTLAPQLTRTIRMTSTSA